SQVRRYWKSHSSLFQHVGIFRSLGGFQALQEKKFGKLLFDNPEANLSRTLTVVPTYDVKFLYFSGGEPEGRMDTCDFSASPQKQKLTLRFGARFGALSGAGKWEENKPCHWLARFF
ncbi:unnamed protein product, partial [Effrenium voratum]